jgi:hypothetical protein
MTAVTDTSPIRCDDRMDVMPPNPIRPRLHSEGRNRVGRPVSPFVTEMEEFAHRLRGVLGR